MKSSFKLSKGAMKHDLGLATTRSWWKWNETKKWAGKHIYILAAPAYLRRGEKTKAIWGYNGPDKVK